MRVPSLWAPPFHTHTHTARPCLQVTEDMRTIPSLWPTVSAHLRANPGDLAPLNTLHGVMPGEWARWND